jgi:hypothetical protein
MYVGCLLALALSAQVEDESLTDTWLARLAAQKSANVDLGLPSAGDNFAGFPFKPFSAAYVKKALAEGVDWRTKNAVTPAKSQGSHGVCGTFGRSVAAAPTQQRNPTSSHSFRNSKFYHASVKSGDAELRRQHTLRLADLLWQGTSARARERAVVPVQQFRLA